MRKVRYNIINVLNIHLMSRYFLPVPIGSMPIAVIRLEWADFTKTSPCTTHLDGSTNCKHSPPFRSPSLTTSSARPANRHLEIAVTAKVSEFLQFDGFGRERCKRGTERKCGNSLCATTAPTPAPENARDPVSDGVLRRVKVSRAVLRFQHLRRSFAAKYNENARDPISDGTLRRFKVPAPF